MILQFATIIFDIDKKQNECADIGKPKLPA